MLGRIIGRRPEPLFTDRCRETSAPARQTSALSGKPLVSRQGLTSRKVCGARSVGRRLLEAGVNGGALPVFIRFRKLNRAGVAALPPQVQMVST